MIVQKHKINISLLTGFYIFHIKFTHDLLFISLKEKQLYNDIDRCYYFDFQSY